MCLFKDPLEHCLTGPPVLQATCLSWTSSISITWDLVRNAKTSPAPFQTYMTRICIVTRCLGYCILQFEKHWSLGRSGCSANWRRQEVEQEQELGGHRGRDHHHRGGDMQDPSTVATGQRCRGAGWAPPVGSGRRKAAWEQAEAEVASLNHRIQLVEEELDCTQEHWPLPCKSWRKLRKLLMKAREVWRLLKTEL